MINGIFVSNQPFINIIVAWEQSVKNQIFLLDTGFTGELKITPQISEELNLEEKESAIPVGIGNGKTVQMPLKLAVATMEGVSSYVEVLVDEGVPVAGIGLFSKFGYKVIVDCKYRTVKLEKVA